MHTISDISSSIENIGEDESGQYLDGSRENITIQENVNNDDIESRPHSTKYFCKVFKRFHGRFKTWQKYFRKRFLKGSYVRAIKVQKYFLKYL